MKGKERFVEALVVLAASLLVYAVLLDGPRVYDDVIFTSPDRVLNWHALFSRDYFLFTDERSFQPLVTALQLLAAGNIDLLRCIGILLHSANGLLVAGLGRAAGLHPSAAFAAAVLFVLYPPATEAVAVVSFQGHLLASFATLGALFAWRSGKQVLAFSALALGLLSKESALAILPLIFVLELFFPSRKSYRARNGLAALTALTAAYLVYRFLILTPPEFAALPPAASPAGTFGWYLKSLAIPWPLCLERTKNDATLWPMVLWMGGAVWLLARGRAFALWIWPALALLPVLHFIPFANYSPVADRYLYAASAPLVLMLAAVFYGPRKRIILALLAVIWGGISVTRNALFREPGRLYAQTAVCAPTNPRAHALLGGWQYRVARKAGKAYASYEKAFALDPEMISHFTSPGLTHRQPPSYVRGRLLLEMNRPEKAVPLLLSAVEEASSPLPEAAARSLFGAALAAVGRFDESMREQLTAQAILPSWVMPPWRLAILHMDNNPGKALSLATLALERSPSKNITASVLSVIGDAHWRQKNSPEAEKAWRKSLSLVGIQPVTMISLVELLEGEGRSGEAEEVRVQLRLFLP